MQVLFKAAILFLAGGLAAPRYARASDLLPAGTAITSTSGETVILDDEYLLVDRGEVAGLAIMVRDLERCRAALAECDATGQPIEPPVTRSPSRWSTWAAIAAGSFAAGVVAGVSASGGN